MCLPNSISVWEDAAFSRSCCFWKKNFQTSSIQKRSREDSCINRRVEHNILIHNRNNTCVFLLMSWNSALRMILGKSSSGEKACSLSILQGKATNLVAGEFLSAAAASCAVMLHCMPFIRVVSSWSAFGMKSLKPVWDFSRLRQSRTSFLWTKTRVSHKLYIIGDFSWSRRYSLYGLSCEVSRSQSYGTCCGNGLERAAAPSLHTGSRNTLFPSQWLLPMPIRSVSGFCEM